MIRLSPSPSPQSGLELESDEKRSGEMLMAMAVVGLTTYALFLTNPPLLNSLSSLPTSQSNSVTPTCSHLQERSMFF